MEFVRIVNPTLNFQFFLTFDVLNYIISQHIKP
jgi:hypothetical protein